MAESLGTLDKVDLVEARGAFVAHEESKDTQNSCACETCWSEVLRGLRNSIIPAGYRGAIRVCRAAVLASRADRRAMAESAARKRKEMG